MGRSDKSYQPHAMTHTICSVYR